MADIQNIYEAGQASCASWVTSLTSSDLERLQWLFEDLHLRGLVKSLAIERDSTKLHPSCNPIRGIDTQHLVPEWCGLVA